MSREDNIQMFEEYIANGTSEQKERARNWQTAIGLQDVDIKRWTTMR